MESKLPGPAASAKSRLPAPTFTSRLKAPATAAKRSRSPEQGPSAKRQRTTIENLPKRPADNPAKRSIENSVNTSRGNPAKKTISKENVRPSGGVSRRRSLTKTKPKAVNPPAKPAKGNTKPVGGGTTKTSTAPKAGGSKRPAWDVKGRLEDMEKSMRLKESQIAEWTARIGSLESANNKLTGTVAQAEQEATSISKDKQQLEQKLAETESKLNKITQQHEHDAEVLESTKRQKEALERKVTALRTELADLEVSLTQASAENAGLKVKLSSTESLLNDAEIVKQQQAETIMQLREVVKDFEQQCRQFETERRILHNTVQELKGNIRVFCRVRPLLGDELLGNDGMIQHMDFINDKTIELAKVPSDISLSETIINTTRKASQTGRYSFSFDKVFLPESTQSEVFEEISQLVQSSLDGYNVCIFAYGQTGSGKTFTMEGPSIEDEETMGMISRATLQIFNSTKNLEDQGWQYEFEASFLEIYNETIRDLLGQHDKDVKHTIRPAGDGKDVTVTNLTTKAVRRKEEIIHLLRTASKNRAVGETKCNERSSRSHSVFRLKITGANEITGENCAGTLNLIDLAGSERLKESGATGARLKETQNINTSLSALGNVIMALGNKEAHVPYRNSRLTFLLQNSLGGNSKTLMFVNVSPREEHFSETVNSLRFASKVNQCNIGTATAKTKHGK